MGLMNRVLEERTEPAPGTDAIAVPSPAITAQTHGAGELLNACLEQIDTVSGGVTTPGSLFEFISQLFGIQKGALLVRDSEDDLFKVWAYYNLDPTSRTRLTMARGDIATLCPGITISFRPDTAEPILPFLSFREGRSLESVFLVKLRDRTRLAGVLVILESDLVRLDAQAREMLLTAVSEPLARKLVEERETLFEQMYAPLLLHGPDFQRSVRDLAGSTDTGPYSLLLMRIALDEIESLVTNLLPCYSTARARTDAQRMICSLLGGAGDLCLPEPGRIVASVLIHEQMPSELLVRELEQRLRERMSVLPAAFSLDMELRHYPNESVSLDSLLSTLVPVS